MQSLLFLVYKGQFVNKTFSHSGQDVQLCQNCAKWCRYFKGMGIWMQWSCL